MIEKVIASKISNKKVYYNCEHCGKTHSHGLGGQAGELVNELCVSALILPSFSDGCVETS